MRFEVKTDQGKVFDNNYWILYLSIIFFFSIVLSNISINLSKISKYQEINYLCKLILIDKSSSNFKKLSKLIGQSNKQRVWQLCKEISR